MIKIPVGIPFRDAERLIITATLARNKGNRTQSAYQLQIGVRTLQRKLKAWEKLPPIAIEQLEQ